MITYTEKMIRSAMKKRDADIENNIKRFFPDEDDKLTDFLKVYIHVKGREDFVFLNALGLIDNGEEKIDDKVYDSSEPSPERTEQA